MAIDRTPKLGLPIIPESEYATTKVVDMIKANQGDQPDSAFNIIDEAIDDLYTKIEDVPSSEAIEDLQEQIDAIESRTDVVDIVATKAALDNYDKTTLSENDVIKVLADESRSGAITYYRLVSNSWVFVGAVGPYYTKSEVDTAIAAETTRATGVESGLRTDLSAETAARSSADTTLQTNITNEATRAGLAEVTLQSNIDAEALARANADTALDAKIDAKTNSRVYDSIQELVTDINSLEKSAIHVGDTIYITAASMPALWTVSVEDTSVSYTYTTDDNFLNAITSNKNTTVQVGYFKLFKLSAGSDFKYLVESGDGSLTLNVANNQVISCSSNEITDLNLVLASVKYPFYSEIIFSGNQLWAAQNNFSITNNTGKTLNYIQFNRTISTYNPKTDSSSNANVSLLFYYDNLKLYCYINEAPYSGVNA